MLYKEIVKKISVSAEKKLKQKKYLKEGLFEVVDQGQSLVGGYSNDSNLIVKCDLPVIVFGDHTKCVKFVDFPFVAGADGVKVLRAKEGVDSKYLYYYTLLLTKKMVDKGYARHYQFLEKMEVDVPSLPEQNRIVNKIEELFSELDSAVETLKKTKDQLAVYRQSVLKNAFERAGNQYVRLGSIIEKPRYGTSKKCSYKKNANSIAVFRIPNIDIKSGYIDQDDLKYAEFSPAELKDIDLEKNDILIIRSNGSVSLVGRTAMIRKRDEEATFAGYLMRLRLLESSEIKAKYLHYFLQSHEARIYIENVAKSSSGVNNINSHEVENLRICVCNESTMTRVVSDIETHMTVCDAIEKTVNDALAQAEAMRQSVLKKAFEGEL